MAYLDAALQPAEAPPRPPSTPPVGPTLVALIPREQEVARLIAQGMTMKEVAQQLNVSRRTLETYRARTMEKLNLKNRVDLIRYASKHGWLR